MIGKTQFKIKGLNQEKNFNDLSKKVKIYDFHRLQPDISIFKVSYFDARKTQKMLKGYGYEILEEKNSGFMPFFIKYACNIWILSAIIIAFIGYLIQSPFIWQYEIIGQENLSSQEVVEYIKGNFSNNKNKISTKKVESGLYQQFEEISFVSVIIRGQTLVVNIKEKLLPEEIYGDFEPILSEYDGKVVDISLVSGTMAVAIGDYIQKGDVMIFPYYIDSNGNTNYVDPKAEITLETYTIGNYTHYDDRIEITKTGNTLVMDEVLLNGLVIYTNNTVNNFELYETSVEYLEVSHNNILPLKLRRTTYYELQAQEIHETFEEAEEEIVALAKEKALENSENYDIIKEEFYNVKHLSGATAVEYVIVGEKTFGG